MGRIIEIDEKIERLQKEKKQLIIDKYSKYNSQENLNKFKKSFGQNVRKYRRKAGFKQAQLGEIVDLSRTSIVNIETGRQAPTIERVFKLANALRIETYLLFEDTFDPKKTE